MIRKPLLFAFALVWAIGVSAPTVAGQQPPPVTHVVAFLHASVVPMNEERVLRDYTVVTADGKILAVGPASAVKVPADALRVDAKGRYLLPALCDMHVHLLSEAWNMMLPEAARPRSEDIPFESFVFPYLASGVTTVQVLSATTEDIRLRGRINRGELLGPRLILARMIDGPKKAWPPPLSTWVESAAEAREAVRRAKAEGYDKMKVYSFLNQESYDAIVSTAREVGMDVVGHVPNALSVEYVLDAGQKYIAHTEEIMKHAGGNYSADRIDYFADRMAKRGVFMTPTLVTSRSILGLFENSDAIYTRPEAAYFRHPLQVGVWSFMVQNLYLPIPADARKKLADGFERFQRPLTKAFRDKGGKMMAGSDTLMPGLYPGTSLHDELKEMVEVGMTPFEALRSSTTTPFEYLGEASRAGTIEVGRQSDLLLVDGNPLQDVSAVSKIAGVLMRGRWIGADEIRRKMQAIADSYKAPGGKAAQAQSHPSPR